MQADEKLEAASYFLEEMRKSVENRKIFAFNLDAFLCTSRSVTLVLRKEFKHDPKFEKWYSQKEEEMKNDELMQFFKKTRDFSIHEGSPETRILTSVNALGTISVSFSASVKVMRLNGTEEKFEPQNPTIKKEQPVTNEKPKIFTGLFFDGRTDGDVITLCSHYYVELFRVVMDAKTVLGV
jgi:hypothetical protein